MAPSKIEERRAKEARERLKGYQARKVMHDHVQKRRVRDNWIAGILIVVVATGAAFAQIFYFSGGPGTPEAVPTPSATPTDAAAPGQNSGDVPSADLAENRSWTGTLTINDVPLGIELDGAKAPQGVSSFLSLSQSGFYDGVSCHRLTNGPEFAVLQCGSPDGTGGGGPGYSYGPVENDPADGFYPAGTIAMARVGNDGYSMGSQFFVVYADTKLPSDTAGGYTVLGHVTSGLDELTAQVTSKGVADGSSDGAPAIPVAITSVTVE